MKQDLDSRLKTVFDEIVAHTPEIGDPPTEDTVGLSAETTPRSRPWVAVAAAAVAVVGIAGLIAIRSVSSDTTDPVVATRPSDVSNLPAVTTPQSVTPTVTTIVDSDPAIIQPGEVVCLNAGASQRAVTLCVDELGGIPLEAGHVTESSFVMPVDPANAAHVDATTRVANAFGIEARAFDPALVRPGADTQGALVYLVIGANDAPYAS